MLSESTCVLVPFEILHCSSCFFTEFCLYNFSVIEVDVVVVVFFWKESVLVVLTFCPSTCLATDESAIIANVGLKMTNSTMLGLVTPA